jgi:hypothetical protein
MRRTMSESTRPETAVSSIFARHAPTPQLGRPLLDRQDPDHLSITGVGLNFPTDLSFEDWEHAGHRLSGLVNSSLWCLGDWLVFGKKHYSDRYMRAIRAAGLQYQTLRNYAWVSRRFELGRRRPTLTFQHHAEVASMAQDKQDFWLDVAEKKMWTTKQLRMHIRSQRGDDDARDRASVIPRIEVLNSRLELWRKAADHSGVNFDNWVMRALDSAAEQALGDN